MFDLSHLFEEGFVLISKFKRFVANSAPAKVGLVLSMFHLLAFGVVWSIFTFSVPAAEFVWFWIFWYPFDFPVSGLTPPIWALFPENIELNSLIHYLHQAVPYFVHLGLGTVWWFCMPATIVWFFSRAKEKVFSQKIKRNGKTEASRIRQIENEIAKWTGISFVSLILLTFGLLFYLEKTEIDVDYSYLWTFDPPREGSEINPAELLETLENESSAKIHEKIFKISSGQTNILPLLNDLFLEKRDKYPEIQWNIVASESIRARLAQVLIIANEANLVSVDREKIHGFARGLVENEDEFLVAQGLAILEAFHDEGDIDAFLKAARTKDPTLFRISVFALASMCTDAAFDASFEVMEGIDESDELLFTLEAVAPLYAWDRPVAPCRK